MKLLQVKRKMFNQCRDQCQLLRVNVEMMFCNALDKF